MPVKHAKIVSPSKLKQIVLCPASALASKGLVDDRKNDAAAEGTAMHHLAEICLKFGSNAIGHVGQKLEGDIVCTQAHADIVQPYLEWTREYLDLYGGEMFVELSLNIAWLTGRKDDIGTADLIILGPGELVVGDLKTGQTYVSAKNNAQLMAYAISALEQIDPFGSCSQVRFLIAQEPNGGNKEFVMSVEELQAQGEYLRAKAQEAIKYYNEGTCPGDAYNPSYDACKYCLAGKQFKCAARVAAVEEIVGQPLTADDFEEFNAEPLTEINLAKLQRAVPFLEDFTEDVKNETHRRLSNGESVEGFKLVKGKPGNRKWSEDSENILKALADQEKKLYSSPSLISPTEAEKLKKAGQISEEMWEKLSENICRAEGKPVVTFAADKRPAIEIESF